MSKITAKQEKTLENYHLKGKLLKGLGDELLPHLEGDCKGLAAEVLEDESLIIYQFERSGSEISAKPAFNVVNGEISQRSGRAFGVVPVKPEGRSVGLFISKSCKVLVPLRV